MLVAGTDEAGVGCWAGPLVAVTVTMEVPVERVTEIKDWWPLENVDDSKTLGKRKKMLLREELPSFIIQNDGEVGVGVSSVDTYNNRGHVYAWDSALGESVLKATRKVDLRPHLLIIDGTRHIDGYPWPQRAEPKADGNYFLVAAASILAKLLRDDIMDAMHKRHPEYGWGDNKGYGTRHHEDALMKHGLSPLHRVQPCETALERLRKKRR
jgi:ribonuclease HII